jgi:hypothetical protein
LFKIILKKNRKLQKMWRKIKQKSSMIPIASQSWPESKQSIKGKET